MKTKEQISYNMTRVRSSGSKMELRLGSALWAAGIRYRKQYKKVPGRPDFAVVWAKLAVFCDSAFWHGRYWPEEYESIKGSGDFWLKKIRRNIERDRLVERELIKVGWRFLRFWDEEIEIRTEECVVAVKSALKGIAAKKR